MQLSLQYPKFTNLNDPKKQRSDKKSSAPTFSELLPHLYNDLNQSTHAAKDKKLLKLYKIIDLGG